MPIYEYKCTECDNHFELMQKMTDDPATECPKCSGKVEKQISSSSFQLKGGGWYNDGYSKAGSGGGDKPTGGGGGCGHGGGCSNC